MSNDTSVGVAAMTAIDSLGFRVLEQPLMRITILAKAQQGNVGHCFS